MFIIMICFVKIDVNISNSVLLHVMGWGDCVTIKLLRMIKECNRFNIFICFLNILIEFNIIQTLLLVTDKQG